MKLWTTMPARVYEETIGKHGYYRCDSLKVSYFWMMELISSLQMHTAGWLNI